MDAMLVSMRIRLAIALRVPSIHDGKSQEAADIADANVARGAVWLTESGRELLKAGALPLVDGRADLISLADSGLAGITAYGF